MSLLSQTLGWDNSAASRQFDSVMAGANGKGGGGSSETTTDTGPPPWQEEQLRYAAEEARRLYDTTNGPQLYSGNWTAQLTPEERRAQALALNYATTGGGSDIISRSQDAYQFGLSDVLNPESNQYLAATADAANRQVAQAFNEQIMPGISSEATGTGNVGSSRQGIAEGLAAGRAAQAMSDATNQLYSTAYSRGLDTFDRTLGQSQDVFNLGMQPASIYSSVGAQNRAFDQAQIDQERATYEYNQQLPYMMLEQFARGVSGDFGGTGTTYSSYPPSLMGKATNTQGIF